MKSFAEVKI